MRSIVELDDIPVGIDARDAAALLALATAVVLLERHIRQGAGR